MHHQRLEVIIKQRSIMICHSSQAEGGTGMRTLLRIFGKILLIPIWVLVTVMHCLVKIMIEVYCIGKGIINLILGLMLIGTLIWYREWTRFAILAVASGILLFFLWAGVLLEVMLESAKMKIGELIIR